MSVPNVSKTSASRIAFALGATLVLVSGFVPTLTAQLPVPEACSRLGRVYQAGDATLTLLPATLDDATGPCAVLATVSLLGVGQQSMLVLVPFKIEIVAGGTTGGVCPGDLGAVMVETLTDYAVAAGGPGAGFVAVTGADTLGKVVTCSSEGAASDDSAQMGPPKDVSLSTFTVAAACPGLDATATDFDSVSVHYSAVGNAADICLTDEDIETDPCAVEPWLPIVCSDLVPCPDGQYGPGQPACAPQVNACYDSQIGVYGVYCTDPPQPCVQPQIGVQNIQCLNPPTFCPSPSVGVNDSCVVECGTDEIGADLNTISLSGESNKACVSKSFKAPVLVTYDSTVCATVNALDLILYDYIFVGGTPAGVPPSLLYTVWTRDQYHCLYPDAGDRVRLYTPVPLMPMSAEEAEAMEADISSGEYRDPGFTPCWINCEEEYDMSAGGTVNPLFSASAPTGADSFTMDSLSSGSVADPANGARLGNQSGFQLTIVPPGPDDPNAPSSDDPCHEDATRKGANDLGLALTAAIQTICTISTTTSAQWHTTATYQPSTFPGQGSAGPTTDSSKIERRFDAYVRVNLPWLMGFSNATHQVYTNRLATTWVHAMDNIGIADMTWSTVQAEKRAGSNPPRGYPNHAVAQHELSHLFLDGAPGAAHYPDDGWKKNTCLTWHWHSSWNGGRWHRHDYWNVMNYCAMYAGYAGYNSRYSPFDYVNTMRDNALNTTGA